MEDNALNPEPRPNESDNEHEVHEEGNILNISHSSQSSHMGFPQTLQIQREIFILRGDHITLQDAEEFYEQAQRMPHLHIKQCMQRQAIDLLHVKIMTDQSTLSVISNEQRLNWQNLLPKQNNIPREYIEFNRLSYVRSCLYDSKNKNKKKRRKKEESDHGNLKKRFLLKNCHAILKKYSISIAFHRWLSRLSNKPI